MTVTINAKGTSHSTFRIGKTGSTIDNQGVVKAAPAGHVVVETDYGDVITAGADGSLSITSTTLAINGQVWPTSTGAAEQVLMAGDLGTTEWVTLSKADVGLANVDNTSDLDKPISTLVQGALDTKLSLSGGTLTGRVTGTAVSMVSFIDKTVVNELATGAVTLDLSQGAVFELTLTGNVVASLLNIPTLSNETLGFVVRVTQGATAYSLTWFSGITWLTIDGVAPDAPAAGKTIEYMFTTRNGTAFLGRKGAAT